MGVIGYHSFDGGMHLFSRNAIKELSVAYGLPVWQLECGTWEHHDDSWENGMFYANLIRDDIVEANASTWHYGAYLLWDGHWNHSFDLIRVHNNGTYTITPRYYALKHYAKFVKNGAKRVESSSTDSNLKVSAFKDEINQRLIIVVINNASASRTVNFIFIPIAISPSSFSGTQSSKTQNFQDIGSFSVINNTLHVTLPGSSMTTFVGSLSTGLYYRLTTIKDGTGSGTITSSPASIDCGTDCTKTYIGGTPVTLTATPAVGSVFTGWSGGGCSGTGTCIVTMNADTSVTAIFNTSGPELTGEWEELSSSKGGKRISGKFRVENVGYKDAGKFKVAFYLSKDSNSLDILIKKITLSRGLKAGNYKNISLTYTSKESLLGMYIITVVDLENQVDEIDEANNEISREIP